MRTVVRRAIQCGCNSADEPPRAAFEFLDEDDPTKLDVRTADPVSVLRVA